MKYWLCIKYRFFGKRVSEVDNKYRISVLVVKCGIDTGLKSTSVTKITIMKIQMVPNAPVYGAVCLKIELPITLRYHLGSTHCTQQFESRTFHCYQSSLYKKYR